MIKNLHDPSPVSIISFAKGFCSLNSDTKKGAAVQYDNPPFFDISSILKYPQTNRRIDSRQ